MASRQRTRYFARQLVGADDLTQDQLYLREKSRRHNRMLHGWGIVCGARVRAGDAPCEVVVEAGYVLGPYGDEIMIDADLVVDVCSEDLNGNVASPCGTVDPWCSDVRVDRPAGQPVYLAVAYEECPSRPVRAVFDGCGCDESACEYSRVRESFRIVVLDDLPSAYAGGEPPTSASALSCQQDKQADPCDRRPCWPCPTGPWVILADLTVRGGAVTAIDCDSHRRYVASFGGYYFSCQPQKLDRDDIRTRLRRSLRADALRDFEESGGVAVPPATEWFGDRLAVEGVEENSALGRRLKTTTIGDIASQGRDAFVAAMVAASSPARRETVAEQAANIWAKAADVVITLGERA